MTFFSWINARLGQTSGTAHVRPVRLRPISIAANKLAEFRKHCIDACPYLIKLRDEREKTARSDRDNQIKELKEAFRKGEIDAAEYSEETKLLRESVSIQQYRSPDSFLFTGFIMAVTQGHAISDETSERIIQKGVCWQSLISYTYLPVEFNELKNELSKIKLISGICHCLSGSRYIPLPGTTDFFNKLSTEKKIEYLFNGELRADFKEAGVLMPSELPQNLRYYSRFEDIVKKIDEAALISEPDLDALARGISDREFETFTETIASLDRALTRAISRLTEKQLEEERRDKARKAEFEKLKAAQEAKGLRYFEGQWVSESRLKALSAIKLNLDGNFQELDPFEFESFVGKLFESMGYTVEITKKTGDYGIDIIARRQDTSRTMQDIAAIQVKRYAPGNLVSNQEIQKLLGAMKLKSVRANKGIFITTSDYTRQAEEQAAGTDVELWNGAYLKEMVLKYLIDNAGGFKHQND